MEFEQGRSLIDEDLRLDKEPLKLRCDGQVKREFELFGKDPFCSGVTRMQAPRQVGYIRVSTQDQTTDRQVLQLEAVCDDLQIEHVSAVARERPVFDRVLAGLQSGDTFVVVDLDRAFRSSIDAMLTADLLRSRSVKMRILSLPIDTATPEGELFYTMVAAFATFERRIIARRTREGMEAARRRGVRLGRPACLSVETVYEAHTWIAETGLPCRYVASLLGVSRITLQRSFRRLGISYPIAESDRD